MAWRLHLTNQTIPQIHILPGKTALVAASAGGSIHYFDLETGIAVGQRSLKDAPAVSRSDDRWQEYMTSLIAPNKAYPPFVRANRSDIYISDDGRMRLYYTGGTDLFLEVDGKEGKLEPGGAADFLAVGLDRFLGLIGALDEQNRLHIYQQHIPVGVFDIGLKRHDDLRPQIAIANGGSIFVTGGQDILVVDSGGRVLRRQETHYAMRKLDCSANGRWVATCDLETNVLRAYTGTDLMPTHQRHAIDLMADATQIQLLADLPPAQVAVSALTIGSKGVVAFAMGGVICVSDMTLMTALPRPQKLL